MLQFGFVGRAAAVGLLISLCASLLGVGLVLKRRSMIGDGLSHVSFGAMAAATAFHAAPLAVALPASAMAAFLLLRLGEGSRVKGDAAIAFASTGSLALGVALISATSKSNTDLYNYMFGSIYTLTGADVWLSAALSAAVLALFALFYDKIFAVTFDEDFARATGMRTGGYNVLTALLTAVTVVLGMRMMGALLISGLLVFPALTSMRIFRTFRSVTLCSAGVAVLSFLAGMLASFYGAPAGAAIVLVNIALFVIFWAVQKVGTAIKGSK